MVFCGYKYGKAYTPSLCEVKAPLLSSMQEGCYEVDEAPDNGFSGGPAIGLQSDPPTLLGLTVCRIDGERKKAWIVPIHVICSGVEESRNDIEKRGLSVPSLFETTSPSQNDQDMSSRECSLAPQGTCKIRAELLKFLQNTPSELLGALSSSIGTMGQGIEKTIDAYLQAPLETMSEALDETYSKLAEPSILHEFIGLLLPAFLRGYHAGMIVREYVKSQPASSVVLEVPGPPSFVMAECLVAAYQGRAARFERRRGANDLDSPNRIDLKLTQVSGETVARGVKEAQKEQLMGLETQLRSYVRAHMPSHYPKNPYPKMEARQFRGMLKKKRYFVVFQGESPEFGLAFQEELKDFPAPDVVIQQMATDVPDDQTDELLRILELDLHNMRDIFPEADSEV